MPEKHYPEKKNGEGKALRKRRMKEIGGRASLLTRSASLSEKHPVLVSREKEKEGRGETGLGGTREEKIEICRPSQKKKKRCK